MQAPKQSYHRGDLREKLIESAQQMLHNEGLATLSLRKIARDVGVAPSAVYNHFKNLDALLESVAADGHRQVAAIQEATYTGRGKADTRLRVLARQYLHFAADNPELYRLMFRPRPPLLDSESELHQASDTTFRFLVEWWHGEGSYDPTKSAIFYPRALAVWSILHGGAMEIIDKQVTTGSDADTSIDRLADLLLDALLDGMRQHLPKRKRSP